MRKSPEIQTVKRFKFRARKRPVLTVVIPVRNINGSRIRNCVKSIEFQSLRFFTLIISDYGSSSGNFKKLMEDMKDVECTVYRCPTKAVWSLSIARNIGIRRARGEIVATLDADLILEPKVLSTIIKQYKERKDALVISSVCDLPSTLSPDKIKLPEDYDTLMENCKPRYGVGGLMSAPRKWWHKVGGFDERMRGWGAEDDDLRKRALKDDRKPFNIQRLKRPHIKVYHQYHETPLLVASKQITRENLDKLWKANNRIFRNERTIIRNDDNWGLFYGN